MMYEGFWVKRHIKQLQPPIYCLITNEIIHFVCPAFTCGLNVNVNLNGDFCGPIFGCREVTVEFMGPTAPSGSLLCRYVN